MENQRNLILAVVLSAVLLFGWDYVMSTYFPQPETVEGVETADTPAERAIVGDDGVAVSEGEIRRDLASALATPERVRIDAPEIEGSINLIGARVDDIELKKHRRSVDRDSGPVQMLAPLGTPLQHFARFDWVGEGVSLPGPQTQWTASGDVLTPGSPATLTWNNGEGQVFANTIAIDDHYLLTVRQAIRNIGEGSIAVRPRALLNRTSATADPSTWNVHSGPVSANADGVDFDWDYDDVAEEGPVSLAGATDWLGFTDIYWLSALVAEEGASASGTFTQAGGDNFAAVLLYDPVTIASGETVSRTTRLFAGAKETAVLDLYEDQGVEKFGLAIDWGWFRFIVVAIHAVLIWLFELVGNFGLAIICLTLVVRLLMFPIAQKQFASMAQMRAIQPRQKALQERYKDDKPKLQQEMAKLFKEEKVNPLAGCLPIFLQIPIFFALYKTLMLAIEMRHQPFVLWLEDLSAPDPATILNLFGLLPFDPPGFLAIGVLAVLLGVTMWLQFKLNPAVMDPMQQQIFMIMPWVLMFVMANFAAGLLLYWITSNILTLGQQKYLYSKHPQLKAQAEKEAAGKAAKSE